MLPDDSGPRWENHQTVEIKNEGFNIILWDGDTYYNIRFNGKCWLIREYGFVNCEVIL